jgi:tripeptidyl-peptidase I
MMSLFTVIACLSLLFLSVSTSPLHQRLEYTVKESHPVPPGWKEIGKPHPLQPLILKIGLEPGNFDSLEQHLLQVSDPTHARYGHHLSSQDVRDLLQPHQATIEAVDEWLGSCGVGQDSPDANPAQDWITLTLPVKDVERLLDTTYFIYRNEDGALLMRTTQWSLPRSLHDHITTIQPTTAFSTNAQLRNVLSAGANFDAQAAALAANASTLQRSCNWQAMTPNCLRLLYGTYSYVPQSHNTSIGYTNFLGEISNATDANAYITNLRPELRQQGGNASTVSQVSINKGPVDEKDAAGTLEGNL